MQIQNEHLGLEYKQLESKKNFNLNHSVAISEKQTLPFTVFRHKLSIQKMMRWCIVEERNRYEELDFVVKYLTRLYRVTKFPCMINRQFSRVNIFLSSALGVNRLQPLESPSLISLSTRMYIYYVCHYVYYQIIKICL